MKNNILIALLFISVLSLSSCKRTTFTISGLTYEIVSPTEVQLRVANKSVTQVNISPTITHKNRTYHVTSIGMEAFDGCSALTSVTIPNSVTSIGDYAFFECSGLTSITIPNSVTEIGHEAFYDCDRLTSITIPNSVTAIEFGAFLGCDSLTSPVYNAHCFAYMPTSYSGAYTIPEGIKQIAGAAFDGCKSLTSISIPNSVTSIGEYAFYDCTRLTSVTVPSHTKIGYEAFPEDTEIIRK